MYIVNRQLSRALVAQQVAGRWSLRFWYMYCESAFSTYIWWRSRDVSRSRDVAHVDVMDYVVVLRTLAHYTVRESCTGRHIPAIHPPSVQIHQSIRFPAGFCNISTWKASSGRNLKTNFTKTRWCCKTAGGLLPLTRLSHDSEIFVVRSAFVKAFPECRMNQKNRPGRTSFRSVTTICDREHYQ